MSETKRAVSWSLEACLCLGVMIGDGAAWAPAPLPRRERVRPDGGLVSAWRVVRATAYGKHYAHETSPGQVWVITHDTILIRYKNEQPEEFTYRFDPTARPQAIDLTLNGHKTSPLLGIYEQKGDRLKICRSRANRPASLDEYELARGEVWYLLERVQK